MHRTYYIAAALLSLVLLLPWLLAQDIAVEGAVNASIARNLAEGIGTFWQPQYTIDPQSIFTSHPPLAFGLESLFFMLFGDAWYTERFYSLLMALLTAWGVIELWKTFYSERNHQRMLWLPLLFWITVPVVFWSYRNNMVDNTLAMFTTFATVFMLRACVLQAAEFFVLGVLFTIAAFITKGIEGLFPLLIPFLYGLHDYRHGLIKGIIQTVINTTVFSGLVLGIVLILPGAKESINYYLYKEVFAFITTLNMQMLSQHAAILLHLTKHLLPALLCLGAVMVIRTRRRSVPVEMRRTARFAIILGLVAALPLLLLKDLSISSLLPLIPFFAIAFSTTILPVTMQSMEDRSASWRSLGFVFNLLTFVTLVVSCTILYQQPTHYQRLLSDAEKISETVDQAKIISCDWHTVDDHGLNAYLQRMHHINLVGGTNYQYLIMKKSANLNPPDGYAVQLVPLSNYVLYKKI